MRARYFLCESGNRQGWRECRFCRSKNLRSRESSRLSFSRLRPLPLTLALSPKGRGDKKFAARQIARFRCRSDFSRELPGIAVKTAPTKSIRGFTLVELVITIVVLGIAVGGVMAAYTNIIARSADPLLRVQAAAIAQSYLEEITLRPVTDPDGIGGETRANYDNVADYNGLNEAPTDQFGMPLPGLGAYNVQVAVTGATLAGVPAQQIVVTVTQPDGASLALTGYRTNY